METIYDKLFRTEAYNIAPDTEYRYVKALEFIDKVYQNNSTIADISSGRGIFLKLLENKFDKENLAFTDIKKFAISDIKFIPLDLNNLDSRLSFNYKFDIITVLDVLEHLSKNEIDNILKFLSEMCSYAYFTIANHSDIQSGVEVHTIQENNFYWNKIIRKYFNIISYETHYNGRLYLYELSVINLKNA